MTNDHPQHCFPVAATTLSIAWSVDVTIPSIAFQELPLSEVLFGRKL